MSRFQTQGLHIFTQKNMGLGPYILSHLQAQNPLNPTLLPKPTPKLSHRRNQLFLTRKWRAFCPKPLKKSSTQKSSGPLLSNPNDASLSRSVYAAPSKNISELPHLLIFKYFSELFICIYICMY